MFSHTLQQYVWVDSLLLHPAWVTAFVLPSRSGSPDLSQEERKRERGRGKKLREGQKHDCHVNKADIIFRGEQRKKRGFKEDFRSPSDAG